MKNSKLTRTCIGCRQKKQKNELIRIINYNGEAKLDLEQKLEGRGAYICKSKKCFETIRKGNKLKNALKTNNIETVKILGDIEKEV